MLRSTANCNISTMAYDLTVGISVFNSNKTQVYVVFRFHFDTRVYIIGSRFIFELAIKYIRELWILSCNNPDMNPEIIIIATLYKGHLKSSWRGLLSQ